MATKQGMCKNCGSLVMFDDRDELCECIFCNCVFPSAEAVKILENPDGYEFKNEKIEKQEGNKHYYANPVMPDIVEKAVARDKTSKSQPNAVKLQANEFEISPNDVKAPKKLVIGMAAGVVLAVAIILAIAFPLYFSRKALHDSISNDLDFIYATSSNVNYSEFAFKQANIYGLSCQYIKLGLSNDIDEAAVTALYSNYTKLRADKRGGDASGNVEMFVYTPDTVFHATKDGVTKDVQEKVTIIETTETSK